MFGLISKNKVLREVKRIYEENATDKAWSENNFYYRMGIANALSALCSRLDIASLPTDLNGSMKNTPTIIPADKEENS